MELEQLKLILSTIQNTAEGAKDLGIWWLGLHYVTPFLTGVCWVVGVWVVLRGIAVVVRLTYSDETTEGRLRGIRDAMWVGSCGSVTSSEYYEMKNRVRRWMEGEQG